MKRTEYEKLTADEIKRFQQEDIDQIFKEIFRDIQSLLYGTKGSALAKYYIFSKFCIECAEEFKQGLIAANATLEPDYDLVKKEHELRRLLNHYQRIFDAYYK